MLQRVPTTPVTAKAANEGRTICGEVGDGESAIEGAMHGIAISLVVPLHDRMQMSLSRARTQITVFVLIAQFRKIILH